MVGTLTSAFFWIRLFLLLGRRSRAAEESGGVGRRRRAAEVLVKWPFYKKLISGQNKYLIVMS